MNASTTSMSRRRFLRGLGVGLALPALDCMAPVFAGSAKGAGVPYRMLIISNNLGVLPKPFFPQDAGVDYTLSPTLEELQAFRGDFTVISGLSHPAVVGGHSTENCFLTAARDPTRSGFRNSISLDQFAVESLGQQTRFPTLNLGVNIDKANRSLSWTRDGVLLPPEDSPARLFRKMFVQGSRREIEQRLYQLQERRSILDAVNEDMRRFSRNLGMDDRDRLDQYFTSVRELEERLYVAGAWEKRPKPTIDRESPQDIRDDAKLFEKIQLMLSMAQLALETDSTRIVTLMIDAYATPVFEINENLRSINGYHNLSHHGQVKEKVAQLEKVDRRQMRLLRELFANLSHRKEGNARLLDRTMVLYGSNMGDANTHDNTNLPVLLAGGGFKHGQHLAFDHDSNTPLANLFVSMLQRMGIEVDRFASSTGSLSGLESAPI
ncbi:MAG: DUF1552 domain-containing protein [Planctomycetes bacterium]|nr:DUF1552 domain-containing protein [Planctomycetota bacterium]